MPSKGMRLERIDRFAQRHHGLINKAAAARLGITRAEWYLAISSGAIERLYPNVARVWGSPPTMRQQALAAVWAAGPGAMASHGNSASLWLPGYSGDGRTHITLPDRRYSRLAGVVVHRPRDQVDLRPILRDAVPTTNPLRMLVDLGAVDPGAVESAVIAVISAKLASPAAIKSALLRHARHGRNGVAPLRRALAAWFGEELPPDSDLESEMGKLRIEYDLPSMQFHAIVIGYEVDFQVDGTRVILECDGWGSHGLNRDQFEFDRMRNAELVAAGYIIVHFTWRRLRDEPAWVANKIREVLDRWALRPRSSGSGHDSSP